MSSRVQGEVDDPGIMPWKIRVRVRVAKAWPVASSGLQPASKNEVLLQSTHLLYLTSCLWLFSCYNSGAEQLTEVIQAFPSASVVKNLPAMQEPQQTWVWSLGWEDPLEKETATHSRFLPGKSHGQRSLAGYSSWFQESWPGLRDD